MCSSDLAGISGFAGVLFGMYVRVNPNVGLTILLPAFSVIILGTLGSIRGALIASVIIGMVRAISAPVLISAGSKLDRPCTSRPDLRLGQSNQKGPHFPSS